MGEVTAFVEKFVFLRNEHSKRQPKKFSKKKNVKNWSGEDEIADHIALEKVQ